MHADAIVEEQDTHLVLGPAHAIEAPGESYVTLIRQAMKQKPRPVGTVWVVTRTRPARVLAIVHDLDAEPACRENWVENAYVKVCAAIQTYGFRVVALPLLGTVHGRLGPVRSLKLLEQAVNRTSFLNLEKLLIIQPDKAKQIFSA
jgi:hypothetical protein